MRRSVLNQTYTQVIIPFPTLQYITQFALHSDRQACHQQLITDRVFHYEYVAYIDSVLSKCRNMGEWQDN